MPVFSALSPAPCVWPVLRHQWAPLCPRVPVGLSEYSPWQEVERAPGYSDPYFPPSEVAFNWLYILIECHCLSQESLYCEILFYWVSVRTCDCSTATKSRSLYSCLGFICIWVNKNSSVQFSSVAQSCPTLCDSMNCSMPGLPVHHQLTKFIQTYIHRVSDAIQPSHPRSSPSPPAPNPSQHQSLFQWVNVSVNPTS